MDARPINIPECLTPGTSDHVLVIFNNDVTPIDIVVHALMLATQCGPQEAIEETMEAHEKGSAVVHAGSQEVCETAARTMESVGVRTLVRPD
ncbi:MAG: ATP-dependent Clp protease adaptor ClpS [Fimbriimonadaceae bacterium]|nr:ATP-dependent Clp protease adaptor ClpS [Fimbriimonadaceae bacterium]